MPPRPADQVELSFTERLQFLLTCVIVLAKVCRSALTAPLTSPDKRSRVYKRHVAYSVIRHLFTQCSSRIEQYITRALIKMITPLTSLRALSADTDELYRNWAKKASVTPEKETLEDGSDAFWIGSSEAKTVLVYFHGKNVVLDNTNSFLLTFSRRRVQHPSSTWPH